MVVEDAHWADGATLDLIAYLGRRLTRHPALLVLTLRDDEVGADHPLHAVLAGLPRPLVRRLPLPALSTDAVARLVRRAGRDPDGLYQATGGNPLLVTEVLAVTGPGVPPTVRDLVLARLAALSPPAREVAALVSVVPSRAEPYLLDGHPPAAVQECLDRGCWCRRAMRWRSGTSCWVGRYASHCPRCTGSRCTRPYWPGSRPGRTWTPPGWCTTPTTPMIRRPCCTGHP